MVKPITTYVAQKRLSWYDHVMRREDTNVTTMKGRDFDDITLCTSSLRWIDRVQSDLKQHQFDTKLAQNREASDRPRTGIRSAKVSTYIVPTSNNTPVSGSVQSY